MFHVEHEPPLPNKAGWEIRRLAAEAIGSSAEHNDLAGRRSQDAHNPV
jgi:hypothetical protein